MTPIAKAMDIEYVRFAAPDLDRMRRLLLDFGLHDADDAGDGVLRMRGTGAVPAVHETERGDPGLVALGLRVADEAALAAHDGVEVRPAPGP